MPWDIGADQISRTYGVLTLVGGESRYLYDIASRPGQEFSFSLGSTLRLKNDLRLNDGKTLIFGTAGSSDTIGVIGGRLTLSSLEIDLGGSIFPAGRLELPEAKITTIQVTNLLATSIVLPATYPVTTGWDIGADQNYPPVPVGRAQDGSLIATDEIGASNRSWRLDEDGNLILAGTGVLTATGSARQTHRKEFSGDVIQDGTTAPTRNIVGRFVVQEFTIGDDGLIQFALPVDYNGSGLTLKADWGCNEAYATNSGEVKWQGDWAAAPVGETWDAPTHTGTFDSGDINIPATAQERLLSTVGTIANGSLSAGDVVGIKVSRVALTGGVDPTAEPYLSRLVLEWTSDSPVKSNV